MRGSVTGFLFALVLFLSAALYVVMTGWVPSFSGGRTSVTVVDPYPESAQPAPAPQELPNTATSPPSQSAPALVVVTATPFPAQEVVVPTTENTAVPTHTPQPMPTRPAIELLPDGQAAYSVAEEQICFDVWDQGLQGELTPAQFGYCKFAVERER